MKRLTLLVPVLISALLMSCEDPAAQDETAPSSAASPAVAAPQEDPIIEPWAINDTDVMYCSSSLALGEFDDGSMSMKFNADCTGTMSRCGSEIRFKQDPDTMILYIQVLNSNHSPGCMDQGEHDCSYNVSGNNVLSINCGPFWNLPSVN